MLGEPSRIGANVTVRIDVEGIQELLHKLCATLHGLLPCVSGRQPVARVSVTPYRSGLTNRLCKHIALAGLFGIKDAEDLLRRHLQHRVEGNCLHDGISGQLLAVKHNKC